MFFEILTAPDPFNRISATGVERAGGNNRNSRTLHLRGFY